MGTRVSLTASGAGATSFSFTLASPITGVTLQTVSSTQAVLSSSVAATVTVNVTALNGTGGSTASTVTFTTSGTTVGSSVIQVSASATSAPVSTVITLTATASSLSSPTFSYYYAYNGQWVPMTSVSNGVAQIVSSVAGSYTILVVAVDSSGQQNYVQVPISYY